ncbi:TIR domain-containing protein [Treponema sp.]|uniref:toll/interleukin-1 receptor domain-containing protein n=1 Tax=Treponema sp. TaxID=166 RepID=UPI003F0CD7F5
MSVSMYQNNVNRLDKEIADLEAKKARLDSDSANLESRILSVEKTITKRTSLSSLQSKQRQISSYQNDISKKRKSSADLGKKIADKRKKRADEFQRLQKAQELENKKLQDANRRIQQSYERQIVALTNQLTIRNTHSIVESSENSDKEEYDVFVSHAWEDKESFVDEFVAELEKQNLKVWYDKNEIKLGDSMRQKIDEGLKKSRFGIVVLSPDYIKDGKYWTKTELDSLFQLESVNGNRIIPIWHKLLKKDVMAYSPIIAGRLAASTAILTPEEIAKQIKELFTDEGEK